MLNLEDELGDPSDRSDLLAAVTAPVRLGARLARTGAVAVEARLHARTDDAGAARDASWIAGNVLATMGVRVIAPPPGAPAIYHLDDDRVAAVLAVLATLPALVVDGAPWRVRATLRALDVPTVAAEAGRLEAALAARASLLVCGPIPWAALSAAGRASLIAATVTPAPMGYAVELGVPRRLAAAGAAGAGRAALPPAAAADRRWHPAA